MPVRGTSYVAKLVNKILFLGADVTGKKTVPIITIKRDSGILGKRLFSFL